MNTICRSIRLTLASFHDCISLSNSTLHRFLCTARCRSSRDESNVDGRPLQDFLSFDWANEETNDRALRLNNGKQMHCVLSEEISALSICVCVQRSSKQMPNPIRKISMNHCASPSTSSSDWLSMW